MAEGDNQGGGRRGGGRGPIDRKQSMNIYISGPATTSVARSARKVDQHLVDVTTAGTQGLISIERYQAMHNEMADLAQQFDRDLEDLRREHRRELNMQSRRKRSGNASRKKVLAKGNGQDGGNGKAEEPATKSDAGASDNANGASNGQASGKPKAARKKAASKTASVAATTSEDSSDGVSDLVGDD